MGGSLQDWVQGASKSMTMCWDGRESWDGQGLARTALESLPILQVASVPLFSEGAHASSWTWGDRNGEVDAPTAVLLTAMGCIR